MPCKKLKCMVFHTFNNKTLKMTLLSKLWPHQINAIEEQRKHNKCVINMWCGTGKTRTFTIELFINNEKTNVIVFPSLGLINQYCNDYVLSNEEPFKTEFEKYECLAFCSDNDGKLKVKGKIKFTTKENKLHTFLKKKNKQIILVTYQSFEKFINVCIEKNININNLIFDEAHHIVGDKIQNIVFNNDKLDAIVDKTRYYTATPVNKNGIIMYDRDDPENSDCGPLAYEYLYYQAVKDSICKSFETQISLYTQKPTYKNKYQPIFESIIRACLSGKYNYWNILTYHSFVNESEDMNNNISFVKEFASPENKRLVKKLFTRIQNEEFPETKDTYSVENVILKGVHSKTQTRHQIIKNFDQKVAGRIFILSSCGILNEGIDTKWANMGVPINPSKSIVKESQRIGRLVRIPDKGMHPAILLIPCEVDIAKYSSMNTPELRDQMIREELSECGNFNTALNVISAFKYQYDPELFEMCLKYPNMYAPKEIKDNLAKQGLIVGDSQGNLLENLKYVCEKEDIELDTESFKDGKDKEILKEIAEQCDKTIEIHTQNHDEPIKYINVGAVDEEPLRLFYCEDDNTYAPITKKDKKQKIKKRTTTPPKKRKPLFSVHTHPDLEVLWKIKESSIDLNKTFCQGVLDVDITWNEKKWEENLEKVKVFIDENNKRPNKRSENQEERILGNWIGHSLQNYKKESKIMKNKEICDTWTAFINDAKYKEYFIDRHEQWYTNFEKVKQFINEKKKRPISTSKNKEEKYIGCWISQQINKHKNKFHIMKNEEIYDAWTDFTNDNKYKEYFLSNKEGWYYTFGKLKKFIEENNKRPIAKSKSNEEKILGQWLSDQLKNYKKKKGQMEKKYIFDTWTEFINDFKYKKYFIKKEENWRESLIEVKEFINKNKRSPSNGSKNKKEKILATWIQHQNQNYKIKKFMMKNNEIYDYWTVFINDPKYKEYFTNNKETWYENLEKVKQFITEKKKRPTISKNKKEKELYYWIGQQIIKYKNKKGPMKNKEIYDAWTGFINDTLYKKYFMSYQEIWYNNFEKAKQFIIENKKKPNKRSENIKEKKLGNWISNQVKNYKKKKGIMKQKDIYDTWTKFISDIDKNINKTKKSMSKPKISKKKKSETHTQRKERVKSEISILHQKYKTMNSQTLHKHFEENPDKWDEYHKISQANEESFPDEEIPRNKMIEFLEKRPSKRKKVVVDLGCGHAEINQHFKDNKRFEFHNFDHHSSSEVVISKDIKNTGMEDYSVDIAILSLAMWGSNCKEYINEAYRILDTGGTLLIAEAYKRWNKELDEDCNPINKLVKLLEKNNFTIINKKEQKFMFIECRKNKLS